jgi:hypothetical protein
MWNRIKEMKIGEETEEKMKDEKQKNMEVIKSEGTD